MYYYLEHNKSLKHKYKSDEKVLHSESVVAFKTVKNKIKVKFFQHNCLFTRSSVSNGKC